jgi:hypothetical protein
VILIGLTRVVIDMNLVCTSPNVTLIPGWSSLNTPLQFERSEDVYIASIIGWNCHDFVLKSTKWTIKKCSPNCSTVIVLSSSVVMTSSELFIPGFKLSAGVYELMLTAQVVAWSNLSSSVSAYIVVYPSKVIVNLMDSGLMMISHWSNFTLTFSPGVFSIDSNVNVFNASVSNDWNSSFS